KLAALAFRTPRGSTTATRRLRYCGTSIWPAQAGSGRRPFLIDEDFNQRARPGPSAAASPPDANPGLLNDPQAVLQRFFAEQRYDCGDDGQHVRLILALESKHDKSRVILRRGGLHVGEGDVERNERTALAPAHVCDAGVRVAGQPLIHHAHCVVSGLTERDGDLDRQVLVDLELHPPAARRSMTRSRASSAP